MVKIPLPCLNNSIADHKLSIPLFVTWLVPVTRVGLRADKGTGKHNFRKTEQFICLNIEIALIPIFSLNFYPLFSKLSD